MYPCENMMSTLNNFDKAISLIKDAIQGENQDIQFYNYLIKQAPTQEQKNLIESIQNDEIKHNKMFKNIYKDITGNIAPEPKNVNFKQPSSYINGIKQALLNELNTIEEYRQIYSGLPLLCYKDILFEIITDEIKHAIKFNFILYLNCCEKNTQPIKDEKSNRCLNNDFYSDYPIYQRIPNDFNF